MGDEEGEEDEDADSDTEVSNWASSQHQLNNGDDEVEEAVEEEEEEEVQYDDMEGNEVEGPSSWADVQRSQNGGDSR